MRTNHFIITYKNEEGNTVRCKIKKVDSDDYGHTTDYGYTTVIEIEPPVAMNEDEKLGVVMRRAIKSIKGV
jgi:hypothetical protein